MYLLQRVSTLVKVYFEMTRKTLPEDSQNNNTISKKAYVYNNSYQNEDMFSINSGNPLCFNFI